MKDDNVAIDLKEYIPDDKKRKVFTDAVMKLLEESKGNLIPVTYEGEVIAFLRSVPPTELIL